MPEPAGRNDGVKLDNAPLPRQTARRRRLDSGVDRETSAHPAIVVATASCGAEYDLAITLNPRSARAYVGRALVRQQQGRLDDSIADFDRAIGINPSFAEALAGRGFALVLKGRATEAEADFDRALALNSANGVAFAGRGLALLASNQAARAMVAFDQALANGVETSFVPLVHFLRGRALVSLGELDKASAEIDRALALNPKFAEAFVTRGIIFTMKHDNARALEALDRAIALNPQSIESFYARGRLYQDQGKAELATDDFRKATELRAKTVFDTLAQADARKRLEMLGKQTPCRGAGEGPGATCL